MMKNTYGNTEDFMVNVKLVTSIVRFFFMIFRELLQSQQTKQEFLVDQTKITSSSAKKPTSA